MNSVSRLFLTCEVPVVGTRVWSRDRRHTHFGVEKEVRKEKRRKKKEERKKKKEEREKM
jgi:hypothetical protein